MSSSEKARLLLVDDSESNNALIKAILREYEVDIATDGSEALTKLKANRYASLLLDLRIPLVDGFGVLDYLSKENDELLRRTIVVTAAVSPRDLGRVKPFPVFSVIAKPFEIETLLNTVRSCIGRGSQTVGNIVSGGVALVIADLLRHWM